MRILCLTQVFPPDPAAVGQYFHDLIGQALAAGHSCTVITSSRGYENPGLKFPSRREKRYRVIRLPLTSVNKKILALRILGSVSFVLLGVLRALFTRFDLILVSTSPPFAAPGAFILSWIRQKPFFYWVMDINPDQALALGLARKEQWSVRFWQAANRLILRKACRVITLDRFMAERLEKASPEVKISCVPLWPLVLPPLDPEQPGLLRRDLRLENKFLFMYSGNWNRTISLLPLVQAVQTLPANVHLLLMGDGYGRKEIEDYLREKPMQTTLLPFSPLEQLSSYLELADIHLVLQSHRMEGILHPSKTYNALASGKPVLFLGPRKNFFSDILNRYDLGWFLEDPLDVQLLSRTLGEIAKSPELVQKKGLAARSFCQMHSREEVTLSLLGLLSQTPAHRFHHKI